MEDEGEIFGNLPPPRTGRRRTDFDDREVRLNRAYRMMRDEEGPLPPRPRPPGKGGPSINQGAAIATGSTWSAADAAAASPPMTLSNGGLTVTPSGFVGNQPVRGTISHNTGKWYVEFFNSATASASTVMVGFADSSFASGNGKYLGSNGISVGLQMAGFRYTTSGFTCLVPTAVSININDVYQLAIDFDAGKAWFGINNVWQASGVPVTGANPFITMTAAPALGAALFPGMTFYGTGIGVWTLQSTPASQKYLPPGGFQAWDGGPVTPMPPANTVAPVASGTLTVGSTLSCTTGTWTNSPTSYAYQWQRGGVNISGATSSTYVTVSADGGTSVTCVVTATNAGGSASATSNALAIAAASSTWNTADAAAASPPMTLTNSNMTVTYGGSGWRSVRGSTSKSAGKLYVEFKCAVFGSQNYVMIGLGNAGMDITTFPGNSANSASQQIATQYYIGSGFAAGSGSATNVNVTKAGDVVGVAVDFTGQQVFYSLNGVLVTDLSHPQLTFVAATVGPLFPALGLLGATPGTWTLQPTAASQTYAPPSGFTAWG